MDFYGLNDEEVEVSRKKNGSNFIPDSEPTTFWDEFKETFSDPMIRILLIITGIMIVMFFFGYSQIYESIGIIIAVIIVAIITAKTAVTSDKTYRKLKEEQEKEICKVYRNGNIHIINVEDVVVGDKVLLQSGDKVPADGILIDGILKVDNSALNGEAEECKKIAVNEDTSFKDEITGDTFVDDYSLFRGSVIFDGEGVLNVCKVGLNSVMGKMAQEMNEEEPDSPLKVKLSVLANQISKFGYIGALIILFLYFGFFIVNAGGINAYFSSGWVKILQDSIKALSLAIIIVVCAVPEGLPLMISLVLMQNTKKMLEHQVLVRKAIGIETAGSLNVLFSDKTGTITKGSLEVVDFFSAKGSVISKKELEDNKILKEKLLITIVSNSASIYDGNDKIVGGNATEQALLKFIGKKDYSFIKNDEKYEIEIFQSFNSANKFSQVELINDGNTYYKGAPEKILEVAKKGLDEHGNIVDLDTNIINKQIDALASKAMRVLAFGYSKSKLVENKINEDIILIGFVGIRDDVREEAKEAIKEVQKAGIQVTMITGDRLETAVAIAIDAGLMRKESDIAITSSDLSKMTDKELKEKIKDIKVIARALPTDKSRMVRICQEMNLVVGMTGDGVNDSPALKKADVGFAMGSGTEAAKEAGDIVILDDNFKSIKDAIWYGRTIYNNILKFCKFQLVINVAAVLISALSPFFGIEEPLKITHLLFVNLVMDGLGAMMLGNEPALTKYLKEKPRRRDDKIVSKKMFFQIITMAIWFTIISFLFLKFTFFNQFFKNEEQKYSAYFALFILASLFNGFNVRDEEFKIFKNFDQNTTFIKVWIIIVLVQIIIINSSLIPLKIFKWIGNMFSCVPFGIEGWIAVILLAFTMIPIDLLRKCIIKNK